MAELENFWRQPPIAAVGRSWYPPSKVFNLFSTLVTDALKYTWGAHLDCPWNSMTIINDQSEQAQGLAQGAQGPRNQTAQGPDLGRGIFDPTT